MSEYIITDEQLDALFAWIDELLPSESKRPERASLYKRLEVQQLVHCCGCKRFKPREGATLNCRFEHPSMPNAIQWCYATPDGFCAWGVRK